MRPASSSCLLSRWYLRVNHARVPNDKRRVLMLLGVVACVFVWSAIRPHDYFTWFLEVLPALIGVPVLVATYNRFPLTTLAYLLVAIHAVILMVGGHYTY